MNLINHLPTIYDNNITKPIQDALTMQTDKLHNQVQEVLNQMFVDTATWGLSYWEQMLGIPKNLHNTQTRRENIKAKMRSRGTTTISTLKNICEAYSNGEVDIVVDSANYSFVIKFVGSIGIPEAFEELDKTIENIKPCHLSHSYEFTYNAHSKLSQYTHEELSQYTHEELRSSQTLGGA